MQYLLEHRVPIQAQIVLDHAIGDIRRHLLVRHLERGKRLSRKPRSVDTGGEVIGSGSTEVESVDGMDFPRLEFGNFLVISDSC